MKIVFMGTTNFSKTILEKLTKKYTIELVVTQPDKKVGRQRVFQHSVVKEFSLQNKIAVFQPLNLKKDYQKIVDFKPDLIVTAAYGQMIPKELIDSFICVNVHGSLLPARRGGAPVQRAIREGDQKTGVSLVYMTEKLDAGDIINLKEIPIEATDTTTTLMAKLALIGSEMLLDIIENIVKGKVSRTPQDEELATYSFNLTKADELIDFNQPTKTVLRVLNSLLDEPGGAFYFNSQRFKVYKMKKSDIIASNQPGTILQVDKMLTIKTLDGAVDVLEIQSPGKKRMAIKDFLNGQKIFNKGDVIDE